MLAGCPHFGAALQEVPAVMAVPLVAVVEHMLRSSSALVGVAQATKGTPLQVPWVKRSHQEAKPEELLQSSAPQPKQLQLVAEGRVDLAPVRKRKMPCCVVEVAVVVVEVPVRKRKMPRCVAEVRVRHLPLELAADSRRPSQAVRPAPTEQSREWKSGV